MQSDTSAQSVSNSSANTQLALTTQLTTQLDARPAGVRISRTSATEIAASVPLVSIGASYTHIKTLGLAVSANTQRIVAYHAMLERLDGLERADHILHAYLGFNRITCFHPADRRIIIDVLDLAGNPITSLENAPRCRELIVSSTLISDLHGLPEGIKIVRCGHSTHLKSLRGCPSSVELIEASCAPNLVVDERDLPNGLQELIK